MSALDYTAGSPGVSGPTGPSGPSGPSGASGAVTGLKLWFDNVASDLTTPSITGTIYAAVNSNPDTITRSSGSFITAGFTVGQKITTSGFANGANNGTFVVTGVAALTLTLATTHALTAEGAGATVTIATNREKLTRLPVSGVEQDESISVVLADAGVTIDEYLTVTGVPGDVTIPGGGWEFHYWAYVSSTAGGTVTTIKFQVGKVDTSGLFTEFFTTAPTTITATTNGAAQEVRSQYVVPDNTYTLASRLTVSRCGWLRITAAQQPVSRISFIRAQPVALMSTRRSACPHHRASQEQQALPDRLEERAAPEVLEERAAPGLLAEPEEPEEPAGRAGQARPGLQAPLVLGRQDLQDRQAEPAASEAQVAQAGQAVRVARVALARQVLQGHLARPGLRVRRRPASCGCRRRACGRPPQPVVLSTPRSKHPTNHVNYYALDFPDSGITSAEVTVGMPSDWNAGTVTAQFYWTGIADTTTNAVVWGIEGRSYGDGDALEAAYGTQVTVSDANASTANQVRISAATGAVTITGATASEVVQFRIQRLPADGSDTLGATARLLGVMITFVRS